MAFLKFFVPVFLAGLLVLSGCLGGYSSTKPELCYQVSNSQNRDICFHRVAAAKSDALFCNSITDANLKDLCFTDIATGNSWASSSFSNSFD